VIKGLVEIRESAASEAFTKRDIVGQINLTVSALEDVFCPPQIPHFGRFVGVESIVKLLKVETSSKLGHIDRVCFRLARIGVQADSHHSTP
jgi:hypothetical protein